MFRETRAPEMCFQLPYLAGWRISAQSVRSSAARDKEKYRTCRELDYFPRPLSWKVPGRTKIGFE